jgi:hypothetical protein
VISDILFSLKIKEKDKSNIYFQCFFITFGHPVSKIYDYLQKKKKMKESIHSERNIIVNARRQLTIFVFFLFFKFMIAGLRITILHFIILLLFIGFSELKEIIVNKIYGSVTAYTHFFPILLAFVSVSVARLNGRNWNSFFFEAKDKNTV